MLRPGSWFTDYISWFDYLCSSNNLNISVLLQLHACHISNVSCVGLLSWIVPCYIYGKTAETLEESCLVHGLTFLFHPLAWYCMANTRARIREKKGIDVRNCIAYGCLKWCLLFTTGYLVKWLPYNWLLYHLCIATNV